MEKDGNKGVFKDNEMKWNIAEIDVSWMMRGLFWLKLINLKTPCSWEIYIYLLNYYKNMLYHQGKTHIKKNGFLSGRTTKFWVTLKFWVTPRPYSGSYFFLKFFPLMKKSVFFFYVHMSSLSRPFIWFG